MNSVRNLVNHLVKTKHLTVTDAIIEAVEHFNSLHFHDRNSASERIRRLEEQATRADAE